MLYLISSLPVVSDSQKTLIPRGVDTGRHSLWSFNSCTRINGPNRNRRLGLHKYVAGLFHGSDGIVIWFILFYIVVNVEFLSPSCATERLGLVPIAGSPL